MFRKFFHCVQSWVVSVVFQLVQTAWVSVSRSGEYEVSGGSEGIPLLEVFPWVSLLVGRNVPDPQHDKRQPLPPSFRAVAVYGLGIANHGGEIIGLLAEAKAERGGVSARLWSRCRWERCRNFFGEDVLIGDSDLREGIADRGIHAGVGCDHEISELVPNAARLIRDDYAVGAVAEVRYDLGARRALRLVGHEAEEDRKQGRDV